MKMRSVLIGLAVLAGASAPAEKPNMVFILLDDFGYGEVQALNPERGKVPTPQMDALAAEGMVFTDVHTSSSVCTPSRYSILTGRCCWRSRLQRFVLMGYDQPLIPANRLTVAGMLKGQGYRTAAIGKWHLGLELPTAGNEPLNKKGLSNVDWSGRIGGGPCELGFDSFYGIAGSLDMAPWIYIENDRFVGACTEMKTFEKSGKERSVAAQKDFEAGETLDVLTDKAVEYIRKQDGSEPFFAYIALTSPHTPFVPKPEWRGKSGLGGYGDFVMQTDAAVGRIVQAVDEQGLKENTLVIVTSDNGCSVVAMRTRPDKKGHFPNGIYRGAKGSVWDGGHRVPFLVRWPNEVKAGSRSDEVICFTDLFATFAELAGADVPGNAAEDSVSFAAALRGGKIETARKGIVHHGSDGHFAYREGKWKLILDEDSGGWLIPQEQRAPKGSPKAQLYNMEKDPAESTNLYESHPEVAARLLAQLTEYVESGRSTSGAAAQNDVPEIRLWK